ncbi:MAG: thioredoxin family protein [Actinobacteria bacterium]|nr:thioredoxin family protein [Actinomycetota bacterium]
MQVTLQDVEGCPHWQSADRRLPALADDLGFALDHQRSDTPDATQAPRFRGPPTIPIDGRDPFGRGDAPVGWSCRVHETPDGPAGMPTSQALRAVLDR